MHMPFSQRRERGSCRKSYSEKMSYIYTRMGKCMGVSGVSDSKESACNAGDPGLIPGSARSPGEGNGNPLQYSCLGIPMHRAAWRAAVHIVTKKWDMTEVTEHPWHSQYIQLISIYICYIYIVYVQLNHRCTAEIQVCKSNIHQFKK